MGLDIQSRRRKARDKETLAKRLAKERKEKREKERKEKEMSRITDNPLAALAVERPNAPEIGEGVSLSSITGNPAATMKPNSPPKDGGPVDWEAVAEANPGAKKPVVFVPPGSQKAEADKLLPGGEQGPVAPPEDNTIDKFADAAEEAGELAEIDEAALQAAIESGNEGKQETPDPFLPYTDLETPGLWGGLDAEQQALDGGMVEAKNLFDDIDGNLKAQLDDYAAESPIDIEGDQEADPEALAENDLFPDRKGFPQNPLAGSAEDWQEADAGEEEDEPVAEVNPVQAARAKRRSAEFWAERMRAPVQDVMDVMDLAEQELLAENPNATPEEIKQAQIVALETDGGLARHKEVHGGQIQAAVHRQADQINRARIMGVPRGMVMMLDQINDAETPDDIVKGLITAASVYPQFRPMLQNVITGQVSANALKSQLATAMLDANTKRYVADAGRSVPEEPELQEHQILVNDLKELSFSPDGVQQANMVLAGSGIQDQQQRESIVALAFAAPMRAIGQQIANGDQPPSQADIATAKEIVRLAIGEKMPTAAQANRLFGGGLSGTQIERIVSLLFGQAGLRNLHPLGPLRGVAKDWGMGDPATWVGYDDVDNVG